MTDLVFYSDIFLDGYFLVVFIRNDDIIIFTYVMKNSILLLCNRVLLWTNCRSALRTMKKTICIRIYEYTIAAVHLFMMDILTMALRMNPASLLGPCGVVSIDRSAWENGTRRHLQMLSWLARLSLTIKADDSRLSIQSRSKTTSFKTYRLLIIFA